MKISNAAPRPVGQAPGAAIAGLGTSGPGRPDIADPEAVDPVSGGRP